VTSTAAITPEVVEALRSAKVYDLSHPLDASTPIHPSHSPYRIALLRRYGDMVRPDGVSGATEMMVMSGHSSTHMDALGHMSIAGELYGGLDAAEASRGGWGLQSRHIAETPPTISRGLMLDIVAVRGRPLDGGEEVTVEDLQRACELAGTQVEPGDTVFVRTGWYRHWSDAHVFSGEAGGSPGIGMAGATWLVEQGAKLIGSDTMVFEKTDPNGHSLPVHGYLLVRQGINIIEMINVEELAQDGVHTFLFIVSPLRLVGSTGSPIRPLALV
jgi:kynurenine formamidase